MTILAAIVFLLVFAHPASAQAHESGITQLIDRARTALNDLDYKEAGAIATQLVALEAESNRAEHIIALQILAASYYPEETEEQQPDSAQLYLRRLVLIWPEATIPREMSWPGLDDLLETTRGSTFAIASSSDSIHTVGIDGSIPFSVSATQRAYFSLTISPHDGRRPFVIDSSGPSLKSELRVSVVRGDSALLKSGSYDFVIRARALHGDDTRETRYRVQVDATELDWRPEPHALDPHQLLPERTTPNRTRNALLGVGFGALTAIVANTFRAPRPVSTTSADGRAYLVGGSIALGGLIGALVDRGNTIEDNVAANIRYQNDHETAVAATADYNASLRQSYRAIVRLTGVWR